MKLTIKSLETKYGISIEKEYNIGSGKEYLVIYLNDGKHIFNNVYQIDEFMKSRKNRKGN